MSETRNAGPRIPNYPVGSNKPRADRMNAFDQLPKSVRDALNYSGISFCPIGVLEKLETVGRSEAVVSWLRWSDELAWKRIRENA